MLNNHTSADPAVQELLDREAIRECLCRYSRGLDRMDIETLSTVFWPDSRTDNSFGGPTGPEFIEHAKIGLGKVDKSLHMLGQMSIDVKGNRAEAETYFFAYHRANSAVRKPHSFDPPGPFWEMPMGGRYIDTLEKRGTEWRILQRVWIYEWFREDPESHDWALGFSGGKGTRIDGVKPGIRTGARKPHDTLYQPWDERIK